MSAPEASNGRINVSEDKLRAILAEFKLDLLTELQKYATTLSLSELAQGVSKLEARVGQLELSNAAHGGARDYSRFIWPLAVSVALVIAAILPVVFR